jgi:glycosyltransferase involved in cell wall biosynthesis
MTAAGRAAAPPLVSVLTPFYNTASYLDECIESVLSQTYQNFEYLLADNCSTDDSLRIAERHAARDPRIRLIRHETFVNQVQNYNRTLRQISPQSRYVKIVQADDAVFPRCLADMVALAEEHPSVALVGAYRLFGRRVEPATGVPHTVSVMSGREACRRALLNGPYMFGSQTTVMYRADVVRARPAFYPDRRVFADSDTAFEILRDHDFGFVPQILSFSREDDGSIWGSVASFDPLMLFGLVELLTYGPEYLDAGEFVAVSAARRKAYHRFLGESWLRRQPSAFWTFHREGMATVGVELDRAAIRAEAVGVVADFLLQPRRVAAGLVRRARRRRPAVAGIAP